MESNIEPASDGIVGRILPRLQAVSMAQVVCRLPVIEGLIAVLDWGEQGGNDVCSQEDVEGRDGLDSVCVFDGPEDGTES